MAMVNAAQSGAVSGAQISDAIEQLLLSGSLEAVVTMLESLADVEASGSLGMFISRATIRRAMQVASFQSAVPLADRLIGLAVRAPQYRLDAATVELYSSIIAQIRSGDHLRGIAFCALMEELGITSAFASYVHAVRKVRGMASVKALCGTLLQESESTFSNPHASLLRVLRAVGSLGSGEVGPLAHGALQVALPLLQGEDVAAAEAGAVAGLVGPVLVAYASALIQASQPLDAARLVLQAAAGTGSEAATPATRYAAAVSRPFFGGVDTTPLVPNTLLHRTLNDATVAAALPLAPAAAEAVKALLFALSSDSAAAGGSVASGGAPATDPDFWPVLLGNAHIAVTCGDALDSATLRELLTALDSRGNSRAADMAGLVEAVRAAAPGRLRSFHVERTITALTRAGDEASARTLLGWLMSKDHRRTSPRLRVTPRAFYALMHAAAARGDKAAARALIEKMQAAAVVPDATILSAIATFKADSSGAAADASADAAAPSGSTTGRGLEGSSASDTAASAAARYVAAADDLLERAVTSISGSNAGASPAKGPHFFNQVIRLYCAGGRPDKAIEVLDHMADFDVRPGPDTLRTFLTGFALCAPEGVTGLPPSRVPGAWGGQLSPDAYAQAKATATAQRNELAAFLATEAAASAASTPAGPRAAALPPFADAMLLGEVGRLLSDWRLDTIAAAISPAGGVGGAGDASGLLPGFVLPRFTAAVVAPWGVTSPGTALISGGLGDGSEVGVVDTDDAAVSDTDDITAADCAVTHVRVGASCWAEARTASPAGLHTDEEDVEIVATSAVGQSLVAPGPGEDWLPLVGTHVIPRLAAAHMSGREQTHRVADSLVSWGASFLPPARTLALFHAMHQTLALYGPHLASSADWAALAPGLCVIDLRQSHVASASAFLGTWMSCLWREALATHSGEALDPAVWSSGWDGKSHVLLLCGARGSKLRAAMPHLLAAAAGHSQPPAHVEAERGVLLKAPALQAWLQAEKKRCAAELA